MNAHLSATLKLWHLLGVPAGESHFQFCCGVKVIFKIEFLKFFSGSNLKIYIHIFHSGRFYRRPEDCNFSRRSSPKRSAPFKVLVTRTFVYSILRFQADRRSRLQFSERQQICRRVKMLVITIKETREKLPNEMILTRSWDTLYRLQESDEVLGKSNNRISDGRR
jgi:hypothetical protein